MKLYIKKFFKFFKNLNYLIKLLFYIHLNQIYFFFNFTFTFLLLILITAFIKLVFLKLNQKGK